MLSKKAVELSLNFIVILIVSIVIFGFGIKFISTLSSEAKSLTELTFDELDNMIGTLVCEGSDRVCIGIDTKTIKKKELGVFGLKIINILDPPPDQEGQIFDITVEPSNPLGYTKERREITSPAPPLKTHPDSTAPRSIFIKKNDEADIGIGIDVPSNAVSGT